VGGLTAGAGAGVINHTFPQPTLDRWNYAFAQATSPWAAMFSPFGSSYQGQFDDRDGEFLVGFDTTGVVAPGQPLNRYRVKSVKLTARVNYDLAFQYDPTSDAFNTYLTTTPGYVPDADAGRPLELFGVAYRNGWTAGTYTQTTAYRPSGGFSPSLRDRNAYPMVYGAAGQAVDVSNNVTEAFAVTPWAVGQARTNAFQPVPVSPGDFVPANTDFEFTLDLSNPGVIRYVREGLAAGKLNLMVTSMTTTSQQAGGTTPAFYLRAYTLTNTDPGFAPARLDVSVCVGPASDWDCSGTPDLLDIFAFLGDWFAGNGDFNASGQTELLDIFDFLAAWFSGQ
jgi:hypothetical protein